MKNVYLLLFALVVVAASSCKKNYDCTAVDTDGTTKIYHCKDCTKKDASDYEQVILDNGYVSATCEKK